MRILTDQTLQSIPQQAQTQAALNDQLLDLMAVANRLGFYDAADFLRERIVPDPIARPRR